MKRNRHVAFFGTPHPAHANPTLPIISTLVRRGWRVTYLTSGKFAARASALGAEVMTCRVSSEPPPDPSQLLSPHLRIKVPNLNGICGLAERMLAEVKPFYERNRPDLIIYDLIMFAGRLLANEWRIPAVQVSPQYAFDADHYETQIQDVDFREWVFEQGFAADRFFERHGIAADKFLFHRELLNVYTFPRAFQPSGTAKSDPRCLFAGRCGAEQTGYGEWRRTDDGIRPLAVITGSTTYLRDASYLRMYIEAFEGLAWHVVLLVGDGLDVSALGSLSNHVEIVRNTSTLRILPHASLFIFQGGTTSTSEAAYHGVPMIAATCGIAELEWCTETNIVRLGMGVHLKQADMNVEGIRNAVISLSKDIQISQNAMQISRSVRREPGAEEVVNRIEDLLENS